MKISIKGKIKNNRLPIGYRMFILSMIKNILSEYDRDYFKEMFFYKGKKTKRTKPFTFSLYLQDYKMMDDYIRVDGDVTINVSSADMKLIMILFNGFMNMESYGDFIKTSVNILDEKKLTNDYGIFKTLSPIHIKDKEKNDLDIDDLSYNKEFNYYCDLILRSFRGYGLNKEIEFEPIKMKKVIVKEEINGFKEKTGRKFIFIKGYLGIFKLTGDTEDLNLLKELGVGARRSGFGNIDLL